MHDSTRDKQQRFMALFEPLQPRLQRFVLVMTRNEELTKDIIGETILIAFERLDSVRHEKAFLSFLFTIATRVYRRWRRTHDGATANAEEELARLLDTGTPPDIAADVAAMYEALDLLPEKQREAVVLFEVLGFSTNEIREIQGGTVVGVRVRIARGRKKLAQILGVADNPAESTGATDRTSSDTSMETNALHFYSMRAKS
jgi:RNA polymerase sigma-70 factor (ECF subfamily)